MGWKTKLLKGGKAVALIMAPEAIELGVKISSEIYEQQKSLIKIPDLKDVHIDEALRVLKELHLIPTLAIAKPSIAYSDENENKVMSSEPKFGTKVNPETAVKVYYVTLEVIDKSKLMLENAIKEFKTPMVIGLNVYEAREDLEGLGLRVSDKLDKPSISYSNKDDGQVTKITYPNNQKIGPKLKTGERVWLYYINDEVILESKSMEAKKEIESQDRKDKVINFTKDISKETVNRTKTLSQNIGKQLGKINIKSPKKEQK